MDTFCGRYPIGKEFELVRTVTQIPEIGLKNSEDSQVTLIVGKSKEVAIQIKSEQKIEARLTVFVSQNGIVSTEQKNNCLVITALRPGNVVLRVLINDALVPLISGEPEEDNPIEIQVEVM